MVSVRRSPSARTTGPTSAPWTTHAEESERAQQVADVRGVEAEPPRAEQRKRRLVHGERRPVDEINREEHAQVRPIATDRRGPATAIARRPGSLCTVSGSQNHASAAATTVIAAAAQIGAV